MNRSERRKRRQICRNLAGSGVSATHSPLIYEEERRHQLLRLPEQALYKMGEDLSFIRESADQRTFFLEFDVQEEGGAKRKKRVIKEKHLAEPIIAKIVEVVNSYRTSQNYEYNISPPHWKTHEALTNRLRQGENFL
ncbi:hypothetical protein [Paenibacillus sp. V4I5]|uniref:hypothetical protein n=1 Tax=Paenibacillus sp. V4I5 TaxID=3042306 RepID=UPI00279437B2|nr:hypothetical protein [Paenibacillus sp. V4I5]MDQ0920353.1 hypothetical protein [Paenibacillus sp. V4I5]